MNARRRNAYPGSEFGREHLAIIPYLRTNNGPYNGPVCDDCIHGTCPSNCELDLIWDSPCPILDEWRDYLPEEEREMHRDQLADYLREDSRIY